ncbi:MAG: membrane protein insertion efficiency factor YidD [Methylococcales bacterium]|nr:membrane protein insertion efficiency factor YidD [Methylococcales bacterium]
MKQNIKEINVDGEVYECHVEPFLLPSIERLLRGTTDSDIAIQSLDIPNKPVWLHLFVKMLRWYRKRISPKLGNRCVFEPSCSHYAELAFRNKGLVRGFVLTCKRLYRCRPDAGGIDFP